MRFSIASAAGLAALLATASLSRADSFREVGRQPPMAVRTSPATGTFSPASMLPADATSAASDLRPATAAPSVVRPHPAVVRVIVPEKGATSYGSGTLVDVHGRYGLVVTNWHVIKDASGAPTVLFPDYFQSLAHVVKVDRTWDLAALVVWRPTTEPASIAVHAPQPGETLFIAGYGQGLYQQTPGRCTKYWMPAEGYPKEMVELTADARQGDSGGPIFNERGELAGVLWGAGGGTTMGSYCGRVRQFLASIVPHDDRSQQVDSAVRPAASTEPRFGTRSAQSAEAAVWATGDDGGGQPVSDDGWRPARGATLAVRPETPPGLAEQDLSAGSADQAIAPQAAPPLVDWRAIVGRTRPEQGKTLLAIIGAAAIFLRIRRARSAATPTAEA